MNQPLPAPHVSQAPIPNLYVFSYAGVGSRNTPPAILDAMRDIAETLGNADYALSTGGAYGADKAFEDGTMRTDAPVTVHAPWSGYNDYYRGRQRDSDIDVVVPSPLRDLRAKSLLERASKHHPAWNRCDRGVRALFIRNVSILRGALSPRSDSWLPVLAVLAYTPTGLRSGRGAGGTGHTLRVATELNIPVINLSRLTPPADNAAALENVTGRIRNAVLDRCPDLPH